MIIELVRAHCDMARVNGLEHWAVHFDLTFVTSHRHQQYLTGTVRVNIPPAAVKTLIVSDEKRYDCLYSPKHLCWFYKILDSKEFYLLSTAVPPKDYNSLRRVSGETDKVVRNMSQAAHE